MDVSVVRRTADSAELRVCGEVDISTAGVLRMRLHREIDGGRRRLVVDFSGVRFCDASGLRVLVATRNRLLRIGGSLRLSGVSDNLRKILRLTGLEGVFPPTPIPVRP
ncbi:anti-sigma factor antagonist [Bailinhaonella thermotolerans]|uniref:Anti-sigma factor antagonist n=1 Tax=Bailinhaonella thermotolerans TaxID=1070861 RepID=A0A3A4AQZ0_9ACTN|nr:anti-sigma factor antagonist [Bailinhaonella thermotolerans]